MTGIIDQESREASTGLNGDTSTMRHDTYAARASNVVHEITPPTSDYCQVTLPSEVAGLPASSLRDSTRTKGAASTSTPSAGPIAVCGMALRLPGGIRDPESFWDVLYNGRDLRTTIPKSRFNAEGFDSSLGIKGAFNVSHGYFLEDDLACLDTSFFTVGKTELEKMDPQERQIMEVTRECLESAGEIGYNGKRIGCYVGTFGDDCLLL
jgi:hypothetical protein